MSNPSATPNCSEMEQFAISGTLQSSLIINLIISMIAVPILTKSIVFVSKTDVFHINTRLQILIHLFALLLHSVGRLALHSIDLFNYFGSWTSACEIIPDFYRCLILRGFYNIGLALSSMCSISLVLERIAAYYFSSKYEHCSKFFGVLLVAVQIVLAGFYLLSLYFHAAFQPGNVTLFYCQTIASSTGSVWFVIGPLYFVMVAQIGSRIMFQLLMQKSKTLRTIETLSLSNRYNLDQSIRSISALKLLINCNTAVFALLSVVTTSLHFNSDRLSKPNYLALVDAVHILPLYAIIVSISVYNRLKNLGYSRTRQLNHAISVKGDYYFDQFRKQIR